ncbi:MAG: hypothetical protein A2X46_07965 [Lentisphaerae bacterium GWF2_57_35]|nr:MAG: hypothetical protein A2X46_07965 [Lentisphaerae bacterium GWF2_57_35]
MGVGLVLGPAEAESVRRTPLVEAVGRALPCVANIGTERRVIVQYEEAHRQARGALFDRLLDRFWGTAPLLGASNRVQHALGSGVTIHPAGYLLTNFHVTERASSIRVTFADGRSYPAQFVAGDEASDLALLKVEAGAPLPWLELAGDDYLLGETTIALGNPFGLGQTATAGILSACNREARYEGRVLFNDILQTDAAINPGSSGGPLLNIDAQIVGINVATYEEGQNIGFAVPSVRVKNLLTAWLSPRLLGNVSLGFDVEVRPEGLVVSRAETDRATVTTNDLLLAVNGEKVSSVFDFHRALLLVKANDTIPLLIRRDGWERQAQTTVLGLSAAVGARLALEKLGLQFALHRPVTGEGLTIEAVAPESPAARAGLKAGEAVTHLNGANVDRLEDLTAILAAAKAEDVVEAVVVSLDETSADIRARSAVKVLTVR